MTGRAPAGTLLVLCLAAGCPPPEPSPTPEPAPRESGVDVVAAALPLFRADPGPETTADPRIAAAKRAAAEGRVEEALAELGELADDDPTAEAAFLVGWLHYQADRYELALPWIARAVEAGPTFPKARQVFFLYGRCLQESGDLAGARAAYGADSELFPDEADGLYRLALLDLEEGDLEACERRARTALERFERPRDLAKTHALLADVHLARDDLQGARDALEACVGAFPHYEAFYKLSRACVRLGDDEAAERYLALHREWRARAGR